MSHAFKFLERAYLVKVRPAPGDQLPLFGEGETAPAPAPRRAMPEPEALVLEFCPLHKDAPEVPR